jgi:hypothetical protein
MNRKSRAWYALAGFYIVSIIMCALGGDEILALVMADSAANVLAVSDDETDR